MQNLAPHWQKFLKNLGWYVLALVALIILFTFVRTFPVLLTLWAVALIGGGWLAFQFSQCVFGRDEATISEERVNAQVEQALSYQAQIERLIKSTAHKTDQVHLEQLHLQIDAWTAAIYNLAERLSSLRRDDLIRRDTKEVPKAIADLETRLESETDEVVRGQLAHTLENRRKQLASLTQLQTMMRRAEIQIESTLSQLGTIYSQILTGQSTSHVADYDRISADVDEEVRQLQDHLEALREVKLG
ncbi:MAG: hypothetical protein JXM69_01950 [Anaerolineae bacterium]|nr:hypothetical protein [Anaerolineae bacterium]